MRAIQRELANNIKVNTLWMKLYISNQATLTKTSIWQLKENNFEKKRVMERLREQMTPCIL